MRRAVLTVAVLAAGATAPVLGQENRGRIDGLVTDPSGAVVPGVPVTVFNEETHVSATHATDKGGAYLFDLLNPGLYTVTMVSPGFKKFETTHVRVETSAHVGVNARLQIGQADQTVTVTESGGAQLKTEDAVLGFTVESRSAAELPLLYGSPFELQLLAPGVTSTTLATGNHTYEGGPESSKIDGSQSASTEFTLDGAPDSRNGVGITAAYIPNRVFVGEFRLITSPYDASLSHTSGGSLDTSIKNGTSQFHGAANWFYQNPGVDAPSFALTGTPAAGVAYDNEGVEVDGPILRRKLFFFTGYEHQHNAQPGSTSTMTLPTDAEKAGDFSALLPLGTQVTNTATCKVNGVQQYLPAYNSYQIFNPYTTVPVPNCPGLYMRSPYLSNMVTNIDPVAKTILNYYPEPTGSAVQTANGANNFVSQLTQNDYYYSAIGRIDYNLSDSQKLFGHVLYSNRLQPGKNAFFPGASGQTSNLINKAGVLDYTSTLNATSVLDIRYSFTRFTTDTSLTATTTATQLGVNPNALAGIDPAASGFPQVKITGYATLENSDPAFEADDIHDAQVNFTKALGTQNLKVGAEYRLYRANQANLAGEHLSISSSGTYTTALNGGPAAPLGQALAEFEAGIAENTQQTLNAATANDTYYYAGYAQDDWKVRSNLTLNFGLRYEYGSPLQERHDKSVTAFAFNTANPIATTAMANYASKASAAELALVPAANFRVNGGLIYAGQPGSPGNNLWYGQNKNFSPRFGFSYSPTHRLVVRGGFGIFYSQVGQSAAYAISNGYTQTTSTVATLNNGQTFQASLENPFPNGLVQPSGNANGLEQGLGTSITFFPQHPSTPYNLRYSLGFQYELPSDIIVEADYVGSNGDHIRIARDFDAVPDRALSTDATRTPAQVAINTALTTTYPNPFNGITVPGSSSLTGTTISGSQLLRPYPEFTDVTGTDTAGFSSYNALQLSAQKRFSHGYNLSIAYTRSKALDAITFLNGGDAKPWYGVSNGDYPNVLSVSGIYELPFGHGKPFFGSAHGIVGEAIHGFQVEGTYRIQSGQPITFSNAGTLLQPGTQLSAIGDGPSLHNAKQWFNTSAFVTGTTNLLESNLRTFPLRFNNVRQDHQNLLNVGALKKFTVYHERVSMDVRAEAINALNHPVFSAPTSDPSSSNFGIITGFGNSSRVLQFAVEGHF